MTIKKVIVVLIAAVLLGSSSAFPSYTTIDSTSRLYREIAAKPMVLTQKLPARLNSKPIHEDTFELNSLIQGSLERAFHALYTSDVYRDWVFDFFNDVSGNEAITSEILYNSVRYDVSPFTSFSVAFIESRFQIEALNRNSTSIDRGLFQLNSASFPHLTESDFYHMETNVKYGVEYIRWCLDQSDGDERTALAMYNAGIGRVLSGTIPQMTFRYIDRFYDFKEQLMGDFKDALDALVLGG